MRRMFKVLDLFSGIGGSAKGIINYFQQNKIVFDYLAVDNNDNVIEAFKKNVPGIKIIKDNGYDFDINGFDFIWASPPCHTHSMLNMFRDRKNPDMRLWELIKKLQQQKTPYVVENVKPYYKMPIRNNNIFGRHLIWTNIILVDRTGPVSQKVFREMSYGDLLKYHQVDNFVLDHIKDKLEKRKYVRNIFHKDLSYEIIKQFFKPLQKELIFEGEVTR